MGQYFKEVDEQGYRDTLNGPKKLTVVEFITTTCPVCRTMEPVMEEVSEQMNQDATFIKVNVQVHQKLGMENNIMGVPTTRIFCGKQLVSEIVGAVNGIMLRNTIRDLSTHKQECLGTTTRISYEMDGYS